MGRDTKQALPPLVYIPPIPASAKVSGKQLQERAYRFMSVMAGDREGFEEALRALYRLDRKSFLTHIRSWPRDIKNHVMEMTKACGWEK